MRSISRIADVSINTVSGLLDAGKACAEHHDLAVRNVASKRIQADKIWSFRYAKQKNVATAKAAPPWPHIFICVGRQIRIVPCFGRVMVSTL
jgi:hypothetical protein